MRTIFRLVCVLLIFGLFTSVAQAAFVGDLIYYDGVTVNVVKGYGRAGFFYKAGDNWYQRTNEDDFPDVSVGDILLAVYLAQKVNGHRSFTGEWTKILALQVASINVNTYYFSPVPSTVGIPAGYLDLTKDEVLRVNLDLPGNLRPFADEYPGLDTYVQDASQASDGSLWASFKLWLGMATGQYSGNTMGLTLSLTAVSAPGKTFVGTPNFVMTLRLGPLYGSNDPDWELQVTDEQRFRVTPEPGSLAVLAGLGLAGVVGLGLRRRRSG